MCIRDSYSDEQSFSIESVTSLYCLNMLDEDNPGLENYAGLYTNINQINLFISKALDTDILSAKERSYYLGEMYGLRAFYYFHLLRSWGNVIWNEDPSTCLLYTSRGNRTGATDAEYA